MSLNNPCFCGSTQQFSSCCQPFIERKKIPNTPEQLMRSRFSAYAIGSSQYIFDTYAKSSQASQSVNEIDDWSKACNWIALEVHSTSHHDDITNTASEQFVEFSAFYITDDTLCELRENSRFILEPISLNSALLNNSRLDSRPVHQNKAEALLQWRYIDGDIIAHTELAKVSRKSLCPCNNYPTAWSIKKGKKLKQCCGK